MIVQKKLGVGAGVTSCARSSRPGHVARFVCSASGSSEAQSARHVPLPTGAMWLLDTFQVGAAQALLHNPSSWAAFRGSA